MKLLHKLLPLVLLITSPALAMELPTALDQHLRGYFALSCNDAIVKSYEVESIEKLKIDQSSFDTTFNVTVELSDGNTAAVSIEELALSNFAFANIKVVSAQLPDTCKELETLSIYCGSHWLNFDLTLNPKSNVVDVYLAGDGFRGESELRTRVVLAANGNFSAYLTDGQLRLTQAAGEWIAKLVDRHGWESEYPNCRVERP